MCVYEVRIQMHSKNTPNTIIYSHIQSNNHITKIHLYPSHFA